MGQDSIMYIKEFCGFYVIICLGFYGDQGEWVYDRFITIRCDNVIPEEKRDRFLLDKMKKEKNAIINLALNHFKILLKNDFKFDEPQDVKVIREEYKKKNNTLHMFIDEYCQIPEELNDNKKLVIKRSEFRSLYVDYVRKFYSSKGLLNGKEMENTLINKYNCVIKKSHGTWVIDGLWIDPKIKDDLSGYFSGNMEGE